MSQGIGYEDKNETDFGVEHIEELLVLHFCRDEALTASQNGFKMKNNVDE